MLEGEEDEEKGEGQREIMDKEIFLVMNFDCEILTLNSAPIPLTLYNFLNFPSI